MYNGVMALGGPHKPGGILASLYFVLLVILGNCILETISSAEQITSTVSYGASPHLGTASPGGRRGRGAPEGG